MTVIGFHASHEQVHPRQLLDAVIHAEQAGFTAAMCSDHFAPWSSTQGHSGFAWSWLAAALQATSLPFGVVNAPGQRYHPAIIAQAVATLEAMYPGRFWAALGSGEALNEAITGERWPAKHERNQRLHESVDVIRRLLAAEEVSHRGAITVDRARVWTLPEHPPPLLIAAITAPTSAWGARWSDGLLTVAQPRGVLRDIVAAYKNSGGTGPIALQVHASWAPTDDEALALAHEQWRTNVFPPSLSENVDHVSGFEDAATSVRPADMLDHVRVSADPGQHAEWLNEYAGLGFDEIYLHHVGVEQRAFIDTFGDRVLPQLDVTAKIADTAAEPKGTPTP